MDYPTLREMGINDPHEIDRYALQSTDDTDILRIVYRRKKGSLLPASKRFRFGRAEKMQLPEGPKDVARRYYEISPFVRKALVELDQIVSHKREYAHQLAVIKEEVQRLEEETSSRLTYIRKLIDEL